jgi:hypothetical protein
VEQDYVLMAQGEFDQISRRGGAVWARFRAECPETGGSIAFLRAAFDAKGHKALAAIGFRGGELCGAGGLCLLVKEDDNPEELSLGREVNG